MDARASSVPARQGRPPDSVGPDCSADALLGPDDLRKTVIVIVALLIVITATWVAAAVLSTRTGAQEAPDFQFNLYAADRGAGPGAMRFKVQIRNIYSLPICYAIGAISIQELDAKHPDKDFMGGCADGELLTLREIADRALALLPRDQPQGKNQ